VINRAVASVTDACSGFGTASALRARASEYQRMARTASNLRDLQALDDLAFRYGELAQEREAAGRMATPEPGKPRLPSPQALKMAAEAIGRGYVCPETILHPLVASSIMALAHQLMAYGLVPAECAPVAAKSLPVKPAVNALQVLLVDDTADVLLAVGAFLVGAGFVVVAAGDGDTALRLIATNPQIGVLVTDFVMPGLSGVELIAQATQMRPDLKALLITAYPNADGLAELPSHIKVLTKPFRRAALIKRVQGLLQETSPVPADEAMMFVENRQA
jgi:CheY-like chemotaxis protein